MKTINYIFVITFIFILLAPSIDKIVKIEERLGLINTENRELEKTPKFDMNNLGVFSQNLKAYYVDNFGLKPLFVGAFNSFKLKVLQEEIPMFNQPNTIVKGTENWMFFFYTSDPYTGSQFEEKLGMKSMSNDELLSIKTNLQKINEFGKQNNIEILTAVVPEKQTVYKEFLPPFLINSSNQTRLEQLSQYLSNAGDINYLDLTPELIEAKSKYENAIYLKNDSHWTRIGAYIGYETIMNSLYTSLKNPSLVPFKIESIKKDGTTTEEDLTKLLGLRQIDLQTDLENLSLKINLEKKDKTNKKLIMIKDSFYVRGLQSYITNHFQEINEILNRDIKNTGLKESISSNKPDIIIIEIAERNATNHFFYKNLAEELTD